MAIAKTDAIAMDPSRFAWNYAGRKSRITYEHMMPPLFLLELKGERGRLRKADLIARERVQAAVF